MIETTRQWLARIGSKEAMENRQKMRLSGEMNAPLRGPRSLRDCAKYLQEHGLIKSRKLAPSTKQDPPAPKPKPHIIIPSAAVPAKQKKDWQKRGRSSN